MEGRGGGETPSLLLLLPLPCILPSHKQTNTYGSNKIEEEEEEEEEEEGKMPRQTVFKAALPQDLFPPPVTVMNALLFSLSLSLSLSHIT